MQLLTNSQDLPEALSLSELGALLLKHYGIHEGLYDVSVEFQIGLGAFGPDADKQLPSAIVGLSRVGLAPAAKQSPQTLDASKINPAMHPTEKVARAAKPAKTK